MIAFWRQQFARHKILPGKGARARMNEWWDVMMKSTRNCSDYLRRIALEDVILHGRAGRCMKMRHEIQRRRQKKAISNDSYRLTHASFECTHVAAERQNGDAAQASKALPVAVGPGQVLDNGTNQVTCYGSTITVERGYLAICWSIGTFSYRNRLVKFKRVP